MNKQNKAKKEFYISGPRFYMNFFPLLKRGLVGVAIQSDKEKQVEKATDKGRERRRYYEEVYLRWEIIAI